MPSVTRHQAESQKSLVQEARHQLDELAIALPDRPHVPLRELFGVRPDIRELGPVSSHTNSQSQNGKSHSILRRFSPELEECEPRFFVPLREFLPYLKAEGVERKLVSQAYFVKQDWNRFLVAVPELRVYRDIFRVYPVTQIRIRCTHQRGVKTKFELSVKAKIDPNQPERKIDVPVELSGERFLALAAFADAGCLQKLRYVVPGHLYPHSKLRSGGASAPHVPVAVEGDILLRAGNPLETIPRKRSRFCLAEVDVRDPALLPALRNGWHSFPFLKPEMDLHLRGDAVRSPLRMETLAAKGFTDEAARVAAQLHKEYRSLRNALSEDD